MRQEVDVDQAELMASQLDWSDFDGRTISGVSILIDQDSTPRCSLSNCHIYIQKNRSLDLSQVEAYWGCVLEGPGKVFFPKTSQTPR